MNLFYILSLCSAMFVAGQDNATQLPPPPLLVSGNRLVRPTDQKPFFFKGVVIQHLFQTDMDPLAKSNLNVCQTTVKVLKGMGANTALVYRVDPTESHRECMQLMQDNDIQVLIGLSPDYGQYNSTYSPQLWTNVTRTIDEFIHYPNTLGYLPWIENNQSFQDDESHRLQFVIKKSLLRDIRNYIRRKYQPKTLPLLGANLLYPKDGNITTLSEYLMCGKRDTQPDFLTLGTFSHCHSFSQIDIDALVPRNLTIPMIFTELGCSSSQRSFDIWKQVAEDTELSNVYSGGFAYELFGSGENYGLVSVNGGNSNATLADNLATTWRTINPQLTVNNVHRNSFMCPADIPVPIPENNLDDLMRQPSLDVCNCALVHAPCISTLEEPAKLSQQLTSLCSDEPKCGEYLAPIVGNFSQCNMITRISLLASLKHKEGSSCPTDMKANPTFSQMNVTKYFDSATKCESLWTVKLPVLTLNPGDFYGHTPTNSTSWAVATFGLPSTTLAVALLITSLLSV